VYADRVENSTRFSQTKYAAREAAPVPRPRGKKIAINDSNEIGRRSLLKTSTGWFLGILELVCTVLVDRSRRPPLATGS
jgi:hypothetical protein